MVQDVVIAIYMGGSKQVFVYRRFLQLDQWRNIPPVVGGRECEVWYFPSSPFGFHGHFLLKEYQIYPQYQQKVDFSAFSFWASTKPRDPQKLAKMLLGQGVILRGPELRLLSASSPGECFATPTIPAAPTPSWLYWEFYSLWIHSFSQEDQFPVCHPFG